MKYITAVLMICCFTGILNSQMKSDITISIPNLPKFLAICGYNYDSFSKKDVSVAINNKTFGGAFEDNDGDVTTPRELCVSLLSLEKSNIQLVPTEAGRLLLNQLTDKEKGLGILYQLKELQRIYPGKAADYNQLEAELKEKYKLSSKEVVSYYLVATKQYLQECAKNNKYFTYFIPSTDKINPEMNIILQYLLNADRPEKKNAVLKLFIKFSYEAGAKGKGSPQWQKDEESRDMMGRYGYDDIGNIIHQADESIRLLNK
jgi:hypothetical protein